MYVHVTIRMLTGMFVHLPAGLMTFKQCWQGLHDMDHIKKPGKHVYLCAVECMVHEPCCGARWFVHSCVRWCLLHLMLLYAFGFCGSYNVAADILFVFTGTLGMEGSSVKRASYCNICSPCYHPQWQLLIATSAAARWQCQQPPLSLSISHASAGSLR